jgi:hypothetical protein
VGNGYSAAGPLVASLALAMCESPAATVPRLAFNPLGDVAGGAVRAVLEVFDDAPLDLVLALTRRGATVAGATCVVASRRRTNRRTDLDRLSRRHGRRRGEHSGRPRCRRTAPD